MAICLGNQKEKKKEKEKEKENLNFKNTKIKDAKIQDFENWQFYVRVKDIFLPYCL